MQRSSPGNPLRASWKTALQFWLLTVLLSLVGSRVSSLIVLEFSLRAVAAWTSTGLGAPYSSLSLFLAAALSWALASLSHSLWTHVARLYPLHSTEHYCGKCITLLTSGHTILASVQRVVVLAFALATVASTIMVYDHFLSQNDALKFWTPLTLCYAILVVYIQGSESAHGHTGPVAHCSSATGSLTGAHADRG